MLTISTDRVCNSCKNLSKHYGIVQEARWQVHDVTVEYPFFGNVSELDCMKFIKGGGIRYFLFLLKGRQVGLSHLTLSLQGAGILGKQDASFSNVCHSLGNCIFHFYCAIGG